MHFHTLKDAESYLANILDKPIPAQTLDISPNIRLETKSIPLQADTFVNVYTASWTAQNKASLIIQNSLQSVYQYAQKQPDKALISTGGFFFLADQTRFLPKIRNLNTVISNGNIQSLPSADQDVLCCDNGILHTHYLQAQGIFEINKNSYSWAGARTKKEADAYIYNNACAIIRHQPHEKVKLHRVFDENSRFTPAITDGLWVDLGLVGQEKNLFWVKDIFENGKANIFDYNVVLRLKKSIYLAEKNIGFIPFSSIDRLNFDANTNLSAISVGASLLFDGDIENHPLNQDKSLGSFPLLVHQKSSRLLFFKTQQNTFHLSLYDARPESKFCAGVTMSEAIMLAKSQYDIIEGCFLDSGKSPKICTNQAKNNDIKSYGNQHYLKWSENLADGFWWNPNHGRPMGSFVCVE
jgi:hypothetical protein